MHQIRFRLGLHPRPRIAGFWGLYTSKGREGKRRGEGRRREGWDKEGKKRRRGTKMGKKGSGGKGEEPPITFLATALSVLGPNFTSSIC